MTNENLLLRLVKILDAFEFELNQWKDIGGRDGVLVDDFLDKEISLLMDLIYEVGKLDEEDDRVGEILFDETLTSEGKVKKLKSLV